MALTLIVSFASSSSARPSARARHLRILAVARGGVHHQQRVLVFAAFFIMFATMFRRCRRHHPRSASRWGALLQQVDGADRPHLLFLTGVGR